MRVPTYAVCLCLLSSALPACDDGTSTGNPTQGGGRDEPDGNATGGQEGTSGNCKEVSSEELALDAQSALGFSPNDVLAFVEGTHDETITWNPQDIASYGPESGAQSLKLVITRKGAPRLTKYTLAADNGIEIGGDCSDALEIDLDVALQTGQGALNEHLSTTLSARSAKLARLNLAPDPNALEGSFAVTEVHTAGYKLVQFFLNIELTPFGTSGQLQPVFEIRSADSVGSGAAGRLPLASWGPARCDMGRTAVPRATKVAGFSADDAIALIDTTHGTKLTFAGGAASDIKFSPFQMNGEFVCAELEKTLFNYSGAVGKLAIAGVLGAKSTDGRIDASWPVILSATPNASGALGKLELTFDGDRIASMGSLQQRYGISGVDVSTLDYSQAILALALEPNLPLSGDLRVTGYDVPMCPTEITTTPGGGSSTPGCMGATIVEVTRATFSTP